MKVRSGFISNSSSSSFIAVGVSHWEHKSEFDLLIASVFKKKADDVDYEDLEKYEFGQGQYRINDIDIFTYGDQLNVIGIDAESLIVKDMRLSEMQLECQKRFKANSNIDVPINKIQFRYGECGE